MASFLHSSNRPVNWFKGVGFHSALTIALVSVATLPPLQVLACETGSDSPPPPKTRNR